MCSQTLSRATAFLRTKNGGASGALDRKSAMDVLGDAKSFVCRQSSYKKQKIYYTVNPEMNFKKELQIAVVH